MKSLFTIISLLIIMSCASQKTNKETTNTNSKKQLLNILYEAKTRGKSKIIHLIDDNLTYKDNQQTQNVTISTEQAKKVKEALLEINLEQIKYLKSPTQKRMFDGAMHAILKIKRNNVEYNSANFDDGYPPKELKKLVDLLVKMTP